MALAIARKLWPSIPALVVIVGWAWPAAALGNQLINRYDRLSDSRPSANARHEIAMTPQNTSVPVGSIKMLFCANDPIPSSPCAPPAGFSTSGATLISQDGETGFSLAPGQPANQLLLTRPAALPSGIAARFVIANVTNPSASGTFYLRLETFTSMDGSGGAVETGGVALSINPPFTLATEVPPFLVVCASVTFSTDDCTSGNGYQASFGDFSPSSVRTASSQFIIQTNASSGYNATLSGTTLTAGTNLIPAPATPTPSRPGQSQFGLNLRANISPPIGQAPGGYGAGTITSDYNVLDHFLYRQGDVVAWAAGPDYEIYTIAYIANVASTQPPGIYSTTLTVTGLANF